MKRSIISLAIFVILVTVGVVSELFYTKQLAKEIDSIAENFNGIESCEKLEELFKSKEMANRIFLRENIIERFEMCIQELKHYAVGTDNTGINISLSKLKYFSEDLHRGRTY